MAIKYQSLISWQWSLGKQFTLHVGVLSGLILCRSCAATHSYYANKIILKLKFISLVLYILISKKGTKQNEPKRQIKFQFPKYCICRKIICLPRWNIDVLSVCLLQFSLRMEDWQLPPVKTPVDLSYPLISLLGSTSSYLHQFRPR